jgi:hypothetical protein
MWHLRSGEIAVWMQLVGLLCHVHVAQAGCPAVAYLPGWVGARDDQR